MRLASVGLVLLPVCLTACATFSQREWPLAGTAGEADMLLASARSREQHGDYEQAKQTYQQLLAQDPKNPAAHHRLGLLAVRQGELNEGLEHLQHARTLAPTNAELMGDIGYTLYLQGRLEESAGVLRNALNLDPDNKRSLNNLGLVLGKQGRMQDARGVFRQTGSEAESLAKMGYIHAQLGNLDDAEESFSKALDQDSDLTVAAEALLQIAQQRKEKSKGAAAGPSLARTRTSSDSPLASVSGLEPLPGRQRATRSPRRLTPEEVASTPVNPATDRREDGEDSTKSAQAVQQASFEARDRQGVHAFFTAPAGAEDREIAATSQRSSSIRLTSAEAAESTSSSAAKSR